MNPVFLGGIGLILFSIVASTIIDGNSFGPLVGPSALVLVFFGSVGATIMSYRQSELSRLPRIFQSAMSASPPDVDEIVTRLAELAEVARSEGMLALEQRLEDLEDPALRQGAQLLVDGLDPEQIRELIEIDISAIDERHELGISFFTSLGGYSPTFGMVGTVVGLINMLQNLSDPAQLGIGMALALLTTLYGVLLANVLWLPIASRLTRLNESELAARDVMLDGILAIQSGISPRLLVERLETYLPPEARVGHGERLGARTAAAVQEAA